MNKNWFMMTTLIFTHNLYFYKFCHQKNEFQIKQYFVYNFLLGLKILKIK